MTQNLNKNYISEEELKFLSTSHNISKDLTSDKLDQISKVSKALYRINLIDNKINEFSEKHLNFMPNTINGCRYLLFSGLQKISPQEVNPILTYPKKGSEFDYQSADAMRVSKLLNNLGCKITPLQFAKTWIELIPDNRIIEKIEITGNGFLNLKLNREYIEELIANIIVNGVLPPCIPKRKVVVDFSSPNIAKEMHVGHLRSTIIGDSICRIFEFVGFDVVRVNHIGDWGTQFGMLIAHLEDKVADYNDISKSISDLQQFYKESKKRFDEEEEFKKRAYQNVVSLQNGSDERITRMWQKICEISRNEFTKIYNRLGVVLTEKGESFYQSRMKAVIDELSKCGKLTEDQGCKVVYIPNVKVPLIVVKSDGGYTYDTSDLATIKYRLDEEKGDWILYVVDIGQRLHLESIYAAARLMNWYDPSVQRVEHIGFGVVLGEGKKKFKSRSGDTVKLSELLDESVSRAHAKLIERGFDKEHSQEEIQQISEALGYSCIKYWDLSHNLVADYEFSFDRMLDDRGNTAVYLMYTYSRIRSIIRKSNVSIENIIEYTRKSGIRITNEHEYKLMRKLVHFPEIIHRIVFESYPHYLCEYLFELASTTTEFYDNCQIIDNSKGSIDMNRLAQIYAASQVIKKASELLGLTLIERI